MRKLIFIGLILVMILLSACAPEITTPEEQIPEEAPPTEQVPIEPVIEEPKQTVPSTYLSNVVCEGDTIQATVTNIGTKSWKGIRTFLNGGWDKEPGCEKFDLEPGESTVCTTIDFPIVYRSNRQNVVQIDANGESELIKINCP
jgi:hypothetical protein